MHRFLVARSLMLLRCSVGGVFLYFGALKLFPGLSPAEDLVMTTIDILTLGLVPGRWAVLFTGVVECTLGLLLLTGRFLRLSIYALGLELFGILTPLVLLPGRLFDGPFLSPTLEGQYVLKDITLVAAGMVLACTIRGGRLVRGARTAQPTERADGTGTFSAEDKLRILLGSVRDERSIADVAAENGIGPDDLARWRNEALDGAAASLVPPEGRAKARGHSA